jgi:CO dehydrogenase maturation factor
VIESVRDAALDFCAVDAGQQTRLLTVGTYEAEGIGQSCYHTNLFVAENLISHTELPDDEWLVVDMVAGTDAFSYSLHLQFDAIVLIAEPTPESAEVCTLFGGLAKEAGVDGLVHLVGNKVSDEDDIEFICVRTGLTPVGGIPLLSALKKLRQHGEAVTAEQLADITIQNTLAALYNATLHPAIDARARLSLMIDLHEKLSRKDWVRNAYGDIMTQIDSDYLKEKVA